MKFTKQNNFNLIRLIAALQVALIHGAEHLKLENEYLLKCISVLYYIPGVPIFFTVSGFLITASFDNNKDLGRYVKNRLLRIYPALWLCLLVTIVILASFGYVNFSSLFNKQVLFWLGTQITFFQFYTPDAFRSFGVSSPNGSLWTISIELCFYLAVPLISYLVSRLKIRVNYVYVVLMILSYAYNYWYTVNNLKTAPGLVNKLLGLNLIPYLFYFLLGAIVYQNWEKIKGYYEGKALVWLGIYVAYCLVFSVWAQKFEPTYWPGPYGLVSVIILSQLVLSFAFSYKSLSERVLKDNDISYGIYLYHMPVVNMLVQMGFLHGSVLLAGVIIISSLLAFLSWKLVEKPILSLKNSSIKKVYAN